MKRDRAYLEHILAAILNIERFLEGISKEDFLANVEKQYAVLRGLEKLEKQRKILAKNSNQNTKKYHGKKLPK